MLTFWATIGVQVVYLPLVVLLVVQGIRSGRVAINLTTGLLLLFSGGLGLFDPLESADLSKSLFNVVGLTAMALLLATYPNGRFTPRWTVAVVAAVAAMQVGNVFSGFRLESWIGPLWWMFNCAWILTLLIGGQLYRYVKRSSIDERERAQWPLIALLLQFTIFTVWALALLGLTGAVDDTDWSAAVAVILNSFVGLGFAVGLLAPRIVRVDSAMRAVLTVTIFSFVLLGVFSLLGALLPRSGMDPRAMGLVVGLAAALVAVPLAWASRRLADLVVYRGRPDPLRILTDLGNRLDSAVDPMAVPQTVVDSIGGVLGLRGVRLAGDRPLSAETGVLEGVTVSFPVVYQGDQIAVLEVTPRPGESRLTAHDQSVIEHLVRQAAGALHGARAISELVDARARVVLAREEERRRLRRDLHDDLAPTFAGLGLGAAAVQEFARSGDPRAELAAGDLVGGLQSATRQIREIAYDLRPRVLDDQGLVEAVRDRVESAASVPEVVVDGPVERLVLPAAVEAAALRIVQEAVMNVRRHAAAERCTVTITREPTSLAVEVTDDGRGLPDDRRDGVGLRSIRERAAELGGTMLVERRKAGGTRVFVYIPVPV